MKAPLRNRLLVQVTGPRLQGGQAEGVGRTLPPVGPSGELDAG